MKLKKLNKATSVFLSIILMLTAVFSVPITVNAEESVYQSGDHNGGDYKSGDYWYRLLPDGTAEITEYVGGGTYDNPNLDVNQLYLQSRGVDVAKYPYYIKCIDFSDDGNARWIYTFNTTQFGFTDVSDGNGGLIKIIQGCDGSFICNYVDYCTNTNPNLDNVKEIGVCDSKPYYNSESYIAVSSLHDGVVATNCDLDADLFYKAPQNGIIDTLTIPSTLDGFTVTSLGNYSFSNTYHINTVIIPDTVTVIKASAFYSSNCTNIQLPNGLKTIERYAFECCYRLEKIEIPDSVTEIGEYAFYSCRRLKTAKLPNNLTTISFAMFYCCYELEEVIIPDSVKTIEGWAFNSCYNLEEIEIPDSVTEIGTSAFYYCTSLKAIKLSSNLTTIAESMVTCCESLEEVIIPSGVTEIGNKSFGYCKNLENVTIPSTVTKIADDAFEGCDKLNISGKSDSPALDYAKKNNIPIKSTDESDMPELKFKAPEFSIPVPDIIPILGGETIQLDPNCYGNRPSYLDNYLPMKVSITGDSVKVSIGTDTKFLEDASWQDFKNYINGKPSLSKAAGSTNSKFKSFGIDVGISIVGYAEGKISGTGSNRELVEISGNLLVSGDFNFGAEKQFLIPVAPPLVIPIVLKLDIGASVSQSCGLVYDVHSATIACVGETTLTLPSIRASAGVGVQYVCDVSVYGEASNQITIKQPSMATKAVLSGEVGVSAKFLCYCKDFPLVSGDWEYYNSEVAAKAPLTSSSILSSITDSSDYVIDRSSTENTSKWLGCSDYGISGYSLNNNEFNSIKTLQQNIYNSASPTVVKTTDGTAVMVWTADIPTRTNGNHTAIVYSVCKSNSNQWSEPCIIDDDGTADFYPSVAVNENKVYIAWSNASKQFEANVTPEVVAAACEISVTALDTETNTFTAAKTITSNSSFDTTPSLATINGETYVAWLNNSDNNIVQSGTNTIYYANATNTDSIKAEKYTTLDKPVSKLTIGSLSGKPTIAYTVNSTDQTADVNTQPDTTLYCSAVGDSPKQLTDKGVNPLNPQLAKIGSREMLVFYSNGEYYYSVGTGKNNKLFVNNDGIASADYTIVTDNNYNASIICNSSGKNGTDLYNYSYSNDSYSGGWSTAVKLTKSDGYLKSATGFYDDDHNITIAFAQTKPELADQKITENTDLCVTTVAPSHCLNIDKVSFNEEKISSDGNISVDLSVTNTGDFDEYYSNINVYRNNSLYYTENLSTNITKSKTRTVNFSMPYPTDVNNAEEFTVEIVPTSNNKDAYTNNADNPTHSLVLGNTNLKILVEKQSTVKSTSYTANITNKSYVPTKATLLVKKNNPNGETIGKYDLSTINPGESISKSFDYDTLATNAKDTDVLYFVVQSEYENETDYTTNFLVVIDKLNLDDILFGDLNDDGEINMKDIALLQNYIVGNNTLDERSTLAADVNKDGKVNMKDALILQSKISL